MSAKKYVRRNIYRWHRITSLIAALPILLWSLSGFLYPVMNSFKPDVRNQFLPAVSIDTSKILVSLQQALLQNNITVLHNFRIVKLDGNCYYQIQQLNSDTLSYLSCTDGKLLKDGDRLYASYLAQRYLSEPVTKNKQKAMGHQMAADISSVAIMFHKTKPYNKTKITSVELIKKFNKEYKTSNALLPVYKISFDRSDGIRLYIETSTDRMATAVDNKKAWFINFFGITHSWTFLNGMGQTKNVTLGAFSLLCFISSLLGFYVYNIISKKKAASASKSWHRTLGNVFVLTTALYGVSGAWHAFHKLSEKSGKEIVADRSQFSADELNLSFSNLAKSAKANEKFTNISIVKINGENYWQLYLLNGKEKQKRYINTKTFEELADGDIKYGCYLACQFSNNPNHTITHSKCLNQFTNSYSMMNKRLPVIEVGFDANENYYVETSTGHLSAVTNSYDKAERFSFSNLHMHHYWEDWFGDKGKTIQKTVFIFTTLGLLLLALTGCWMYWRKRQKALK
jgi:uncharacterized membrane protein YsdA (DUF1294 family)